MRFKLVKIVATLLVNTLHSCLSEDILSCDADTLDSGCTGDQICNQTSGTCECLEGYTLVDRECIIPSDHTTGHAAITAVVILVTLTLILVGLVLVARKYNLIEYIRNKINARRNNEVMYEDVMIGHDDPPLTL